MNEPAPKKQKTKPKKGKPVEIPVPKRDDVEHALRRIADPKPATRIRNSG